MLHLGTQLLSLLGRRCPLHHRRGGSNSYSDYLDKDEATSGMIFEFALVASYARAFRPPSDLSHERSDPLVGPPPLLGVLGGPRAAAALLQGFIAGFFVAFSQALVAI